ncbi:condensation domain-containing protein, partial [Thermoactinomyces sp. DSM 45892]|uniref:non-ribosomal peptide synthetase n=1 Tax=Thermoactinomyces sp. DSM 45892 TaxID=1882753 RepID=UPI0008971D3A
MGNGEFIKKYSLSEGQRSIFLHYNLYPNSSLYNERGAWCIRSKMNIQYLEEAFLEVIRRHEIFRSIFVMEEEEAIQKVYSEPILDFEFINLDGAEDEAVQEYISLESDRPFVLENGPVPRFRLIRLSDDSHILLLICHHITIDGWTISLLLNEVGLFYKHFNEKTEPNIMPMEHQYSDFVNWQRNTVLNNEESCTFWKNKLSGELPVLNLPADYKHPTTPSGNGGLFLSSFSKEVSDSLHCFCKSRKYPVNIVLLALYITFLYRFSGQDEIVVGTPTFGRRNREFRKIMGYFVNMLPIRIGVSEKMSFRDLVHVVRTELDTCSEHQYYPFSLMAENVVPKQNNSFSPIFQASFVLQKALKQNGAVFLGNATNLINIHGLLLEPFEIDKNNSKFDLTLFVEEENDSSIKFNFEYNTDIFNENTIARFSRYFHDLVYSLVCNPDGLISEVCYLSTEEQKQLLEEWNDTKVEYSYESTIHERFEEQVLRTPEAVAVVYEDRQLTYRELNEQANQLAHYLQKRGVGPESLIGLCVERSPEMMIGLLGILKAGGAYVPLDPTYPEQRLQYILADAGIQVLVTTESLQGW